MHIIRRSLSCSLVLLAIGSSAAACGGGTPTAPTAPAPQPPPSVGGTPVPVREKTTFEVTGIVTDDAGTPIAGARVSIWLDYIDQPSVQTDGAGRYELRFTGTPGANYVRGYDPPGTEDSFAFVNVEAPGYEPHSRHALGTSPLLVENFRLRRVQRLTAGESATVTLDRDDSVCVLDAWPGRELICRTLRVLASRDGLMTVEALPTNSSSDRPSLEVYGGNAGAPRNNPTSLQVTAGTQYTVHVGVPWGVAGNPSLVVTTALSTR